MVQALLLAGADEGFAKGVGLRRFRWDADAAHPGAVPEGIELTGELGVAVVHQNFALQLSVFDVLQERSRILDNPRFTGIVRAGRDEHATRRDVQECDDRQITQAGLRGVFSRKLGTSSQER